MVATVETQIPFSKEDWLKHWKAREAPDELIETLSDLSLSLMAMSSKENSIDGLALMTSLIFLSETIGTSMALAAKTPQVLLDLTTVCEGLVLASKSITNAIARRTVALIMGSDSKGDEQCPA